MVHNSYRELLLPMVIIGAVLGLGSIIFNEYIYCKKYAQAEKYAETIFGDKQPPLTESEREEWHKFMGVEPKGEPNKRQLGKFIDDCFSP